MNFDFSPEQYALRDTARDLFEKVNPPSRLRGIWDADGERDGDAWRAIAEAGIAGLTIPEEHGGQGGDDLDLVLVLEEAGRAGLPEPLLETTAVVAPLLAGLNRPPSRLVRSFAHGEATGGVAYDVTLPVIDADRSAVLALLDAASYSLLEPGSFTATRIPSADRARRLFALSDVRAEPVLDAAVARRAYDRGAAATAAVLNGVSMRLLEMTIEHVTSRRQFGRAVGSFQAVKHMAASMHAAIEGARPAAWYAAYAIARDLPDASEAASVAKAAACEAHGIVNRDALQCHGGIGFTWEHDLHLWLKRGLALVPSFGTARAHRARLEEMLFEEDDDA